MSLYTGLHAAYYDLVYRDKAYAEEARWVGAALARVAPAAAPPGPLLDVACGTGRHAAAFAKLGYRVTGVDYNEELLALAREAAPAERFVQGDMRRLDLGERFAAVTCLFDSIGYALDDEGVVAALATIRRHLEREGAAAVEFLHAPALVSGYSPVRVRRWPTDAGELVRIAETEIAGHRMMVDYELVEFRDDGTYARLRERQDNRFFEVEEMRGLMESAGLDAVEFLPAYARGPVTDETFHVMALTRSFAS